MLKRVSSSLSKEGEWFPVSFVFPYFDCEEPRVHDHKTTTGGLRLTVHRITVLTFSTRSRLHKLQY